MKKILLYMVSAMMIVVGAAACNDTLDVQTDYGFTVEHLPVPKKLKTGETAEIRCQLIRKGRWNDATYQMRYFQPDGVGELRYDDGTLFLPNDLYNIDRETLRLYYTSCSDETQAIDIYFIDSFGKICTLSFSFNNDSKEDEVII